jgi:hypothetical protein
MKIRFFFHQKNFNFSFILGDFETFFKKMVVKRKFLNKFFINFRSFTYFLKFNFFFKNKEKKMKNKLDLKIYKKKFRFGFKKVAKKKKIINRAHYLKVKRNNILGSLASLKMSRLNRFFYKFRKRVFLLNFNFNNFNNFNNFKFYYYKYKNIHALNLLRFFFLIAKLLNIFFIFFNSFLSLKKIGDKLFFKYFLLFFNKKYLKKTKFKFASIALFNFRLKSFAFIFIKFLIVRIFL